MNALSERLDARGPARRIRLAPGVSAGDAARPMEQGEATSETGTTITFMPDDEIFESSSSISRRSRSGCATPRSSHAA